MSRITPWFKIVLLLLVLAAGREARALTNGLALTPPMGWNSWNRFGCNITESLIRQTVDAMATNGMKAAGYQYVNLDDCWQVARDTNGVILADPVAFSGGIASLADFAHARGLMLGVYSDHGTSTCAGRPGSYSYETLDATTYATWGVDYLKYDNCNTVPGSDQQTDYYNMRNALMNSGRPILYSICAWTFQAWMPEGGNLWRTTGDISDNWNSMVSLLDANNNSAFSAGPGRWNDPDMLEVGNGGMTDTEYRAHFGMWCLAAAPLLSGNDLRTMSQATRDILTAPELIAVDQDPAGIQGIRLSSTAGAGGNLEMWSRPIADTFTTRAVALFNRGTNAATISVDWTAIGLATGPASVRDLWARSDLGVFSNRYSAIVPAHGAQLLKIAGAAPSPVYVSDQHFRSADNGWGPVERDQSNGETAANDGRTLTLNGVTYSKGIGVHAPSRLECYLAGRVSRFQSDIGVDDEVGTNGSVIFRVWDGSTLLYDSGLMTGSSATKSIDLDVTGKTRITLEVTDGGDNKNYDHADWAGARLALSAPPTPVTSYWTNRNTAAAQSWDTDANWTNTAAFPNASTAVAVVNADTAANQTINLNRDILVRSLWLGDANASSTYTIAANGGTLTFDAGTASPSLIQLPTSGGDTLSAPLTLNGTLNVTNQSTNVLTMSGTIAGLSSGLTLGGGTLVLGASNSFGGTVTIAQGTVKAGNAFALGIPNTGTVVKDGATLDVNGLNLGLEPVTVSGAGAGGNGAIINNGADVYPALAFLALAGDTAIGGTHRWDLRPAGGTTANPAAAALSTGGIPRNLAKVGTNFFSLVSVTVDPALADVEVRGGTLNFEGNTTGLGNPTNTLTVFSNATLFFYRATNRLNKVIVLQDGATIYNNYQTNIIVGPVTLGAGTAGGPGTCTFNIGGNWMALSNAIGGAGSLVKTGNSPLYLTAANVYTGNTLVNAGTLALAGSGSLDGSSAISVAGGAIVDVSGRADGALTLRSGQVINGNGTINGSLVVSPGATLSPGTSLGALTVTNRVTLQGTTAIELNKSTGTNDVVRGAASVVYGGTLSLTNLGSDLSAGDSFRVFYAAGYSGAFTNIVPAMAGAGLAWDTSGLVSSGTLRVVTAPRPAFSSFALADAPPGTIVLSGTNGVPNATYYVLASTNIALPLAQWTRLATNAFDGLGGFRFTNTTASPQQFHLLQIP